MDSPSKESCSLKVMLVSGSYPPMKCGVGDYTARLAVALQALPGVCVEVLTSGVNQAAEIVDGVAVRRCLEDWSLLRWNSIVRVLRESKPDCVHIQYPTQGYVGGGLHALVPLLAWMMGIKVVQTWHEGFPLRSLPDVLLKAAAPGPLVVVRPNFREKNLQPVFRWLLHRKHFAFIPNSSVVPRVELGDAERSSIRNGLLHGQQRLVVYFGFVLPNKGAELLFDIADPATDFVVVAGGMPDGTSKGLVAERMQDEAWAGKSSAVGYLPLEDAAIMLAAADAVVLPFREGGGEWNTSIHAATVQGTFVLTTSIAPTGYSDHENIYLAKIDDIDEMRKALGEYAGIRAPGYLPLSWEEIALAHMELYGQASRHANNS